MDSAWRSFYMNLTRSAPKPPIEVLYEDNHLLALNKPAGVPTMGVAPQIPSMLSLCKEYLKRKYQKPGNVYVGIVSRLDAPVTGVLLVARTSKAAARLTRQFQQSAVRKEYLAVVEGSLPRSSDELVDWVRKDERHRRMHIASAEAAGAREARLRYRMLKKFPQDSVLSVELVTGRKHQIRLQLSHLGNPVRGDRKYGARQPFPAGIALHASRLELNHPVRQQRVILTAPLPKSWRTAGYGETEFTTRRRPRT